MIFVAIVELLMQALEGRYRETTGVREQVFAAKWHDWIVAASGQLAAFTRYIRENPKRWWLRHINRRYFTQVGRLPLAGREWFAYGNPALLELPVVEPCAEGRMLFLSLYEAQASKLDNATLYRRCHEMGDLAAAALGREEQNS